MNPLALDVCSCGDDTVMQTVHAQHNYYAHEILWGSRLSDVLSELPNGSLVLDLRRFHAYL